MAVIDLNRTNGRQAPHQKAKADRVGQVTSRDTPNPSMDERDIEVQAQDIVQQHLVNAPDLQELLDILNIIRKQGKY